MPLPLVDVMTGEEWVVFRSRTTKVHAQALSLWM